MKSPSPRVARKARHRILILDDHPIMRQGLAQLLAHEPDLQVCGEANEAREALDKIHKCMPDLLLADISLPDRSGLELIKDLQLQCPELKILVLSMHDESLYAERALRAGAKGYIMKRESTKNVIDATRRILEGKLYISNAVAEAITLRSIKGRMAT